MKAKITLLLSIVLIASISCKDSKKNTHDTHKKKNTIGVTQAKVLQNIG